MSRRTDRIGPELREAVQKVIAKGLSDPRVRGLITITNVRVSDDLKRARVGVSVFPVEKETLTLHGLRSASRHIRREAAEIMALAKLPELAFESDASIRRQADLLSAMSQAHQETPEDDEAEGESTDAPDVNAEDREAGET